VKKAYILRLDEHTHDLEKPLYYAGFIDPLRVKLDIGLKVKFYRFWHRYADDTGRPHLKEIHDLDNIVRILNNEINQCKRLN
jgi:hypothetical protein